MVFPPGSRSLPHKHPFDRDPLHTTRLLPSAVMLKLAICASAQVGPLSKRSRASLKGLPVAVSTLISHRLAVSV